MSLTQIAVHRPVTTLMISLMVLLVGWISLSGLSVDLMPELTYPTVSVITLHEGAAPEEVETLLTRPIEQAVSSVAGVDRLSSSSSEGSSTVRVRLIWGSDIDASIADIRQSIGKIRHLLPDEIEEPYVRRYDVADRPIMYMGLTSSLTPIELTKLAEKQIAPRLERIEGVARVGTRGAVRREIQINLDRNALEARNLSINSVVDVLRRESTIKRAGDLKDGNLNLLVRSRGEFESLEAIAQTVVHEHSGAVVRIQDIAEVVDGHERLTEITRTMGKPGMMVYIFKQSGANTVEVADNVRIAVDELNNELKSASLRIRLDKSEFIRQSIDNVRQSAIYGMMLAAAVLVLFLRSFRSTLVIALTMPLSVLATFIFLYFKGFTLNLVSFGGLALGMGLLVDNSIVVLESIFRQRGKGVGAKQAAIQGTREVASAIVASTITTLIVFLPLLFIDGITGVLLHQLAWVVSISLFCSLVASLTLTPVMTTLWEDAPEPHTTRRWHQWPRLLIERFHQFNNLILCTVETFYGRVLGWSLTWSSLVGSLLLLGFSATMGLLPLVGSEFLPKTDEAEIRINGEMAAGVQLETLQQQSQQVEQAYTEGIPEVVVGAAFIGDGADDSDDWHRCHFRVKLLPRSQRERGIEEIRQEIEDRIGAVAGMNIQVKASNEALVFRMLRQRGGGNVEIEIRGHDIDIAEQIADDIATQMKQTHGMTSVRVEKESRRPVMSANIDRAKASLLGISVNDITQAIETTIRGTIATVYHTDDDEFNILVRLDERHRDRPKDVARVGVATPSGKIVPLSNLVSFDFHRDAVSINRLDQQRTIDVSADVIERDLGSVVNELKQRFAEVSVPAGYSIKIAGDWEEQQRSFDALWKGFVFAILLMYAVMASQFESLRNPLIILLTIPLAAIGVVLILVLTDTTLNVQSCIGIVMLAGIVVNNAIVMVDYINQRQRESTDLPLRELICQAAVRRFRPIIMTTITTVLAMSPIALGFGEAGELQAPLARVVIGGLLSGTVITLITIPLVCQWFGTPLKSTNRLLASSSNSTA